jgi:hypothetical protein
MLDASSGCFINNQNYVYKVDGLFSKVKATLDDESCIGSGHSNLTVCITACSTDDTGVETIRMSP